MICPIGGAIGIVVGCVGGIAAANYIGASAVPSVKSILISLGFSMAIGVFSVIIRQIRQPNSTRSMHLDMSKDNDCKNIGFRICLCYNKV